MGRAVAQDRVAAVKVEVDVKVAGHFQEDFFERDEGRAVDPQLLDFRAFGAAGHGLCQRLALPANRQHRRQALGASRVRLLGSGRYLAHALDLEKQRVFLAGGEQATGIYLFSNKQRKLKFLAVRFY